MGADQLVDQQPVGHELCRVGVALRKEANAVMHDDDGVAEGDVVDVEVLFILSIQSDRVNGRGWEETLLVSWQVMAKRETSCTRRMLVKGGPLSTEKKSPGAGVGLPFSRIASHESGRAADALVHFWVQVEVASRTHGEVDWVNEISDRRDVALSRSA